MSVKDKRIEVRVNEDAYHQIQRAADFEHENASEFMRRAAFERAEQVLAQELTTLMSADQFDSLLASLDVADEAPRLTVAAKGPRAYRRG